MNRAILLLTIALLAAFAAPSTARLAAQDVRTGAYTKNIGGRWLGGGITATSELRKSIGRLRDERASTKVTLTADALLLTFRARIARVEGSASNALSAPPARRSASARLRVQVAGSTFYDRTVRASGRIASFSHHFKAFPVDPRISVPVGPIRVTLRGNVGATLIVGLNTQLATTATQAGLSANAGTAAIGRAAVSAGIPGYGVGLSLIARLGQQNLRGSLSAHTHRGYVGGLTYTLTAIALRLVAWVEFWPFDWDTRLASWSSRPITRTLLRL